MASEPYEGISWLELRDQIRREQQRRLEYLDSPNHLQEVEARHEAAEEKICEALRSHPRPGAMLADLIAADVLRLNTKVI